MKTLSAVGMLYSSLYLFPVPFCSRALNLGTRFISDSGEYATHWLSGILIVIMGDSLFWKLSKRRLKSGRRQTERASSTILSAALLQPARATLAPMS